jgi:hypothetical protein
MYLLLAGMIGAAIVNISKTEINQHRRQGPPRKIQTSVSRHSNHQVAED